MQDIQVILDGVKAPVVVLNTELCVVTANRTAKQWFPDLAEGLPAEKAVSKKPGFLRLLRKTLETSHETSMSIQSENGFRREFLVTVRAVRGKEDTPTPNLVLTFEDRSSLKDAKLMRSDFVANVSHEIRSPLTAISGFVETLQGSASDDAEARDMFLKLMAKEAARMTNLVTDLLSLSQVEVKERRKPKKTVDLNMILDQATEAVTSIAQKRGKTVDIQRANILPDILGKHDDLVRLFINLLENAINYSGADSTVTLSAIVAPKTNPLSRSAVCIAIRDQSEGIPAAEIPRLTERFYRVDKSRSRNVGGTGLGLAIVKHILVRHRGRLEIESMLGEGSTFNVYLPIENPTPG